MIFVYPAIITSNVDKDYIPGILRILEDYYLAHIGHALETGALTVITTEYQTGPKGAVTKRSDFTLEQQNNDLEGQELLLEQLLLEHYSELLNSSDDIRTGADEIIRTRNILNNMKNDRTATEENIINATQDSLTAKDNLVNIYKNIVTKIEKFSPDDHDGVIAMVDTFKELAETYKNNFDLIKDRINEYYGGKGSNYIFELLNDQFNLSNKTSQGKNIDELKRDRPKSYPSVDQDNSFINNLKNQWSSYAEKVRLSQDEYEKSEWEEEYTFAKDVAKRAQTYSETKSQLNIVDERNLDINQYQTSSDIKKLENVIVDLESSIKIIDLSIKEAIKDNQTNTMSQLTSTKNKYQTAIVELNKRKDELEDNKEIMKKNQDAVYKMISEIGSLGPRDIDRAKEIKKELHEYLHVTLSEMRRKYPSNNEIKITESNIKDALNVINKKIVALEVEQEMKDKDLKLDPIVTASVDIYKPTEEDISKLRSDIGMIQSKITEYETIKNAKSGSEYQNLRNQIVDSVNILKNKLSILRDKLEDLEKEIIVKDTIQYNERNIINNINKFTKPDDIPALEKEIVKTIEEMNKLEELSRSKDFSNEQLDQIKGKIKILSGLKDIYDERKRELKGIEKEEERKKEETKRKDEEEKAWAERTKSAERAKVTPVNADEYYISPKTVNSTVNVKKKVYYYDDDDNIERIRYDFEKISFGFSVKILPIRVSKHHNLYKVLIDDMYANKIIYIYKGLTRWFLRSVMKTRVFKFLSSIYNTLFGGLSGRSDTGVYKDILLKNKGYVDSSSFKRKANTPKHSYYGAGIVVLSEYDVKERDLNFFEDPQKMRSLFRLGWNSFMIMYPNEQKITFCSYLENGMCTRIPMVYLFQKSKDIYDSLNKLSSKVGNVMGRFQKVNYKKLIKTKD